MLFIVINIIQWITKVIKCMSMVSVVLPSTMHTCSVFLVLFAAAGVAVASNTCTKTVISNHRLASSFEPSDILWDAVGKRLWVVSDTGELASLAPDGSSISYWSIPNKPDLEGIVQIPGREDFVYLQGEVTQELLEFNMHTGQITAAYKLRGSGHLEAVTWIQTNSSSTSVLYAGGQKQGTVHVHSLDFEEGKAIFVEQFSLPAPNPGDLSALYYHIEYDLERECLTALYDRHRLMVRYVRRYGEISNLKWRPFKKWQMPDLGSEGITWADVDDQSYLFVCIDTAHTVPKVRAIHRYLASDLDVCFNGTLL